MRSLATARDVCEKFHKGLLEAIEEIPLMEREGADSPVLELYRTCNGPSLLVPTSYGGQAAGPLEAVRVQRAIAAASPSLGVATVMHHFTIAMLFRLAGITARLTPAQLELLSAIAPKNLLLASGWAEGRTDQNILAPSITAERTPGGYRVNGSKKPCSLSHSMDVLTASVMLTQPDGTSRLALMLIPATSPGITTTPFWSTPILAASQSDEVHLTDVEVPEDLTIISTPEDHGRLDDLQTGGFTWFELLTTAAYTGAASTLVDRVITAGRGSAADRAALGTRLDAAVGLVEGAARALEDGVDGDEAVAAVLTARYASQDLLAATVDQAVEILGGMSYIRSAEVSYLASAVRALAFHPPSRASVAAEMADYFAGGPLRLS
ncbi:acyl-CoA/acyl-ACP dehydrogenase (plasmid) [Streptomyces sp. NBC_00726]|uniref:acyl-CoA dehydrogenase family protein n=1 Tax=Streptomyces sp. NBC_00726 TaxID=2903674 RepID=UPI002F9173E8